MKMGPPDTEALRELYSELGFTSLLRDLAPLTDDRKTDYAAVRNRRATSENFSAP